MKRSTWCAVFFGCVFSALGAGAADQAVQADKQSPSQPAAASVALSSATAEKALPSQTPAAVIGGSGVRSGSTAASTLDAAYAYPNPFKSAQGVSRITFTNLPEKAVIRIFTVSGERVRTISKDDTGADAFWDVRNDGGSQVASGLYLYIIDAGTRKTGKLIVTW